MVRANAGRSAVFAAVLLWAAMAFVQPADASGNRKVQPPRAADIDQVVARAMDVFNVPGLAVGVVKDGQVVMAKGYGVREVGRAGKVDADTVFAIGSNTKSFTTAALAILVDEGRIGWDDKVIDHLPQFRLYDPYVTREFTVRDLLTHRSGLRPGAGDLMVFPDTKFKREEIIAGLHHLRPVSSFRSQFSYNNVLYMVAGELIPKVTGKSWEDFVQRRVLDRLGMDSCSTTRDRAKKAVNVATPHAILDGKLTTVEPLDVSLVAAAGGIQCNVKGMLEWASAQLAGGAAPDGVLFSEARQRDMWTPQTVGPVSPMLTKLHGTHFRAYGLGWNLEDFHGYKRVFHSGGLIGMVSHVTLLPELKLGIVVLANQQSSEAVNAITLHIAKAYIGTGQQDWVGLYKSVADEQRAQITAAEQEVSRAIEAAGSPPLPLSAYVGTYRDAWRGDATVRQSGDELILEFSRTSRLVGTLQHFGNGVFVVRWKDRSLGADAFVRFTQGFDGKVSSMTLQGLPGADGSFDYEDFEFSKVAVDSE
ncbi:MAG TPA: serine hydrolase [Steroidobacter sp.]